MNRTALLGAVVPASLGVALILATAGTPLRPPWPVALRIAGFALWFGAVIMAALASGRRPGPRLRVGATVLAVVTLLAALAGGSLALGLLGVAEQTQLGWITLVIGGILIWLGLIWYRQAMRTSGTFVVACAIVALGVSLTPYRGWTGLVGGVAAGFIMLGQGLWSAVEQLRRD